MQDQHGNHVLTPDDRRQPQERRILRCPACRVGFTDTESGPAEDSLASHLRFEPMCLDRLIRKATRMNLLR